MNENFPRVPKMKTISSIEFSRIEKFIGVFVGWVVTPACFILGQGVSPDWQSGDYVGVMFVPSVNWPFYLLLLFSTVCMFMLLFEPKNMIRLFWIRLGTYTGVLWSFQYMLMVSIPGGNITIERSPFFAITGVGSTIGIIIYWQLAKVFSKYTGVFSWIWFLFNLIITLFIISLCLSYSSGDKVMHICVVVLAWFIPGILISGPFWSFSFYLWLSIRVFRAVRNSEIEKISIRSWLVWLTGYLTAWALSIWSLMTYYSQLRETRPSNDCYIATAAACGHKKFVRSREIILKNGEVLRVNDQLYYLKCGELLLQSSVPRLHKICRCIYDCIGPIIAKTLVRPILADVSYAVLKPAEWSCRIVLRIFSGRYNERMILYKHYRRKK